VAGKTLALTERHLASDRAQLPIVVTPVCSPLGQLCVITETQSLKLEIVNQVLYKIHFLTLLKRSRID